ncbi:unnamed protein product [Candida verbasci]|uniref:PH domain-containing protein n=1 Tax=Candida verbasci TaxID=1227364 RepID=A0A9W4U015_9ASCO|nr:unnamed protein product [Candida verbasci]
MTFKFEKEKILSTKDPKSPFYHNLPSYDSKPINQLVDFFKYWKYFIKAVIYYFKEIILVKELESNLSYQLISAVQFPGCKDLPNKILHDIQLQNPPQSLSPKNTTPTKELKKNLSSSNLASLNTTTSAQQSSSNEVKRPGLSKTKSNNSTFNSSFLKNATNTLHKRNSSLTSIAQPHIPLSLPLPHHNSTIGSVTGNGSSASPLNSPIPRVEQLPKAEINSNDVRIQPNFFPEDSLFTNFPALLLSSHQTKFNNSYKLCKDLNNKIIPKLETLSKQVSHKIKEIKSSLTNESFANSELSKEISKTGQVLNLYMQGVELYSNEKPVLNGNCSDAEGEEELALDDPLLIKLQVDYKLKNQLIMENYMFASYINLQNISKDLFTFILKELNWAIDKFGKLNFNSEYYQYLKTKISNSSTQDWEFFISHNPNFINTYQSTDENPKRETRTFKSITLPYSNSIQNKCLRFGMMYKKSKLLKNYTRYYYILSCNYLHEFKINEEVGGSNASIISKKNKDKIGGFIGYNDEPIKSYNLNDHSIVTKDEASFKFTLIKKSTKSKKTFKCANEKDFNNWYEDLSQLLKYGHDHYARFSFIQNKIDTSEKFIKRTSTDPSILNKKGLQLEFSNQSEPALTGMFTPSIKTPRQSPKVEDNPFDQVFEVPKQKEVSSPSSSTTPKILTPTESHININPNITQHEDYLKLQQAFLKQQQEILDLKLKESKNVDLISKKLEEIQDQVNITPKKSSDSLNSFVIPSNTTPVTEKVLNEKPIFTIDDDSASTTTPPNDVPTVLVSSDH